MALIRNDGVRLYCIPSPQINDQDETMEEEEEDSNPPRKNKRNLSVSSRLSIHQLRKIDQLRQEIPLPRTVLPHSAAQFFPRLRELYVESKLPLYRELEHGCDFYMTRGRLGERVMRQKNLKYTTEDELNQRKVVKSPYDSLHDPNVVHYLRRPAIKQHLEAQGFLRDGGYVVCDLKNFNEFRKYVGVAQTEHLNDILRAEIYRREEQAKLCRTLVSYQSKLGYSKSKDLERAAQRRKMFWNARKQKLKESLRRGEIKRARATKNKAEMHADIEESKIFQANRRNIAYDKAKLPNCEEKRNIMLNILKKEQAAELRVITEKLVRRRLKQIRNLHRNQQIINSQYEKEGLKSKVQDSFDAELKRKAEIYERRMARNYEHFPDRTKARKAEQLHIHALMEKYFYRWLFKHRERRRRSKTRQGPSSSWNVTDTLEHMNDQICEDRIRIVSMKNLIAAAKRQIAIDEKIQEMKPDEWEEEDDRAMILQDLVDSIETPDKTEASKKS